MVIHSELLTVVIILSCAAIMAQRLPPASGLGWNDDEAERRVQRTFIALRRNSLALLTICERAILHRSEDQFAVYQRERKVYEDSCDLCIRYRSQSCRGHRVASDAFGPAR
jgi:hypothetical protein